jgi:hypothetical protein
MNPLSMLNVIDIYPATCVVRRKVIILYYHPMIDASSVSITQHRTMSMVAPLAAATMYYIVSRSKDDEWSSENASSENVRTLALMTLSD